MRSLLLLSAICVLACGCGSGDEEEPDSPPKLVVQNTPHGDLTVGAGVQHENLTVFPILSTEPRNEDRFITLDEGLKAGTVEVRELGAGLEAEANSAPNAARKANEPAAEEPVEAPQQQPSNEQNDESQPPVGGQIAPPAQAAAEPNAAEPLDAPPTLEEFVAQTLEQSPHFNPGDFPGQAQWLEAGGEGVLQSADSVNTLAVVNTSGKPLYLMPGEVIIGGNQDRTVGEEIIIASTGKPVEIDAFCVEHGRWADRGFEANLSLVVNTTANIGEPVQLEVAEELAKKADEGKFVFSPSSLNSKGRFAVQDKASGGQQAVWDNVAAANAASNVETQSDAFTANFAEKSVVERLQPYLDKLREPVAGQPQVIGVAVAINGKVMAVDVFESTPLFKKLWPKLLRSYALDALHAAEQDEENAGKACEGQDALAFLKETFSANVEAEDVKQGVATVRRESDNVAAFVTSVIPVEEGDAAPAAAGGLGGFGGGVHTSGFAK